MHELVQDDQLCFSDLHHNPHQWAADLVVAQGKASGWLMTPRIELEEEEQLESAHAQWIETIGLLYRSQGTALDHAIWTERNHSRAGRAFERRRRCFFLVVVEQEKHLVLAAKMKRRSDQRKQCEGKLLSGNPRMEVSMLRQQL